MIMFERIQFMKKKSAAGIFAALMLTLTACSGGENSSVGDSTLATTAVLEETTAEISPESQFIQNTGYAGEKFVLGGKLTLEMAQDSRLVQGNLARLARVIKSLQNGDDITVGFIGGSITQGSTAGEKDCYARLVTNWIEETFPASKITYINAGIGATGSYIGVHRANKDLLEKGPDLVFVDFSVNDTTERTQINKESYDSLLRTIWESKASPAVVTIAMTMENGTSFQEYHREIVEKYQIPMISYKNSILNVIAKGDIVWDDISDDDIHPNVAGHRVLADLIIDFMGYVRNNLDLIQETEPELGEPAVSDKYENGKISGTADIVPESMGNFELKEGQIGGFNGYWRISADNGVFASEYNPLRFEIECKNIGLLYAKTVKSGSSAEIKIDGESVGVISSDFTGGWGNYAEFQTLASYDEKKLRTIEIFPIDTDEKAAFFVIGFTVS